MEIIHGLENYKADHRCVVTLGTFDGVHLGHIEIIRQLMSVARDKGLKATLVTFHPHPRLIVRSDQKEKVKLLTSLDEKLEVLQNTELDRIVVLKFDRQFAQTPYEEFVRRYLLERLSAEALVIGYDHAFGRNREGNFANLENLSRKYGFYLQKVDPFEIKGQIVSSTFIRQFLQDGDVELAGALLGRKYSIRGQVVRGRSRGKRLSFPTANIELPDTNKMLPADGVYAVDVTCGTMQFKGMLNIGRRPTFSDEGKRTIEVHIIKFNQDIYGKTLKIEFRKRLRDEKKFDTDAELIAQLEIDKQQSLEN